MTQEEYKEEALRIRPQLLRVARRYLEEDDAEDTVQDVLLRLWQMVGELRMPIDGLASVLTRNFCVNRLRCQHPVVSSELSSSSVSDDGPTGNDDRIDRMMTIIEGLPSLQQTILRLRHMEGMEMKDIADLTGSTEVAIRKALSRARQAVRMKYMKQYER